LKNKAIRRHSNGCFGYIARLIGFTRMLALAIYQKLHLYHPITIWSKYIEQTIMKALIHLLTGRLLRLNLYIIRKLVNR